MLDLHKSQINWPCIILDYMDILSAVYHSFAIRFFFINFFSFIRIFTNNKAKDIFNSFRRLQFVAFSLAFFITRVVTSTSARSIIHLWIIILFRIESVSVCEINAKKDVSLNDSNVKVNWHAISSVLLFTDKFPF